MAIDGYFFLLQPVEFFAIPATLPAFISVPTSPSFISSVSFVPSRTVVSAATRGAIGRRKTAQKNVQELYNGIVHIVHFGTREERTPIQADKTDRQTDKTTVREDRLRRTDRQTGSTQKAAAAPAREKYRSRDAIRSRQR